MTNVEGPVLFLPTEPEPTAKEVNQSLIGLVKAVKQCGIKAVITHKRLEGNRNIVCTRSGKDLYESTTASIAYLRPTPVQILLEAAFISDPLLHEWIQADQEQGWRFDVSAERRTTMRPRPSEACIECTPFVVARNRFQFAVLTELPQVLAECQNLILACLRCETKNAACFGDFML